MAKQRKKKVSPYWLSTPPDEGREQDVLVTAPAHHSQLAWEVYGQPCWVVELTLEDKSAEGQRVFCRSNVPTCVTLAAPLTHGGKLLSVMAHAFDGKGFAAVPPTCRFIPSARTAASTRIQLYGTGQRELVVYPTKPARDVLSFAPLGTQPSDFAPNVENYHA